MEWTKILRTDSVQEPYKFFISIFFQDVTAEMVADVEETAGMVVGVTAPFGWTNMVHQPVLTSV